MTNTTTSQENINQTPVPADLILPGALSERLNRLPSEPRYLVPDDIILILSRATGEIDTEFTRQDVTWCRDRAWLALSYVAQLEAQANNLN